jgi:hypothetical protein
VLVCCQPQQEQHQLALLAAIEDYLQVGLAERRGLVLVCRTPESPPPVACGHGSSHQPAATAAEARLAAAAAGGACSSSFFSKEMSDRLIGKNVAQMYIVLLNMFPHDLAIST